MMMFWEKHYYRQLFIEAKLKYFTFSIVFIEKEFIL